MPRIEFSHSDTPGIIRDIDPFRLPPGVYSDVKNMVFKDARVEKAHGYAAFVSSPTISPCTLHFCPLNLKALWIYTGLDDIYAFDGTPTAQKITRASGVYTGSEDDLWTFAFLHGLGILNNGVDLPQLWSPPGLNQVLIDLTNWPASTTCRAIRSYLNYIVALDVTKSTGTRYTQMVKWSDAADPGTVPSSWDTTDATKQAGEHSLSDTPGAAIDCLPLGGSNIIYKEDAVHAQTYIGGRFIFSFQKLPLSFGVLGKNCIAQMPRQHFVATPDDILVHDGIQAKSVINGTNRTWLFNNIEPTGIQNAFVLPYYSRSEMWFCFPLSGQTVSTMAMIWNTAQNSITFRDLPEMRHAVFTPAIKQSSGDSWDFGKARSWETTFTAVAATDVVTLSANHALADLDEVQCTTTGTLPAGLSLATKYYIRDLSSNTCKLAATPGGAAIDITDTGSGTHSISQELAWDAAEFTSTRARVFFINETDDSIDEFDENIFTDGGSNVKSFVERRSMPFGANDRNGNPVVDLESVKFVQEIWPRITGTDGAEVSVYFGTQMKPDDTITWADPVTFTIGTTEFIPVFLSCRLFSIRFEATDSKLFEIQGFAYTLEPTGVF